MARQPVAVVTEEDVRRIILRDFGEARVDEVLSILDEYAKEYPFDDPRPRVRLSKLKGAWRVQVAILKLARGNLDRLLDATVTAIEDCRDVLSAAEYPRYCREIGFGDASGSLEQAVIDDDWRQYCEWLGRTAEVRRPDGRP